MKKKIIALLLVFCLALCFAGCKEEESSGGKSKKDKDGSSGQSQTLSINDAVEKSQKLDAIDAVLNLEMEMTANGVDMTIPLEAQIKSKGLQSGNPVTSVAMKMTMMGQKASMEMYQEGDWVYMVSQGMKYKMSVSEMGDEYDYSDDINNMLQPIPEEIIKESKTEKADDGSTTFTFTMSGEKFSELYDDFLDGVAEDSGMTGGDIKISDVTIKITAADGYVTVYDMAFDMEMTVQGVEAQVDMKASITFKNPGKDVTITPPAGYKDFEELGGYGNLDDFEDLEDFEGLEDLDDFGNFEF